jgi:hypothetical protein
MKHTLDAVDKFIILPQEPHWDYTVKPKGQTCNGRPSYDSGSNPEFLGVEEIKERLSRVG